MASDSRALNLQIMLTINNAAPPPFCDRFDLVAPFTGRQCEPEPRLNAQDVGGGIKRALVSAALRSRASDAHNLLFLEQFCIAGNMDGWGMIH